MSKQDWLDYFEAVNGRSASAEEIAQALAAGEFQEEVVVPETPQAPEFVAAPTAPVEEPVAAPQAPEFVQRQQHQQLQLLLQKNQSQLQFKSLPLKLHSKPTNNRLKQLINKLPTKVNLDNLILPNQVNLV